jgi:predicted AAA+ superfamily ATPase
MIDILKKIILDFQDTELRTGLPRRMEIAALPGKASVFIGVRRAGKSTFMFQTIQKLVDEGVPRTNILYLNFLDDRLHRLRRDGLGAILEAYYALYPEKKNAEKIYCFFDEIQAVSGWEPFIDRLMRTEKCDVYITGSSARRLCRESATQMRGRTLSWEIFPFSFPEYLDFKGVKGTGELSTKQRLLVQKAFGDYWAAGGFPEVAGADRRLRVAVHQDYLNALLFRDLIERHDIAHPRAVIDLAHRLLDNIASLYSINSLAGYLKSMEHKVPKAAVTGYLQWFEDAFFLFTVRLFDPSRSRAHANPKKIYCIDHAMVTSVSAGLLINSGHLLENLVFVALRRIVPEIYYYRTKSGREVDFIIMDCGNKPRLIQVCESMIDQQTRKRETAALIEAMAEMGITSGTIVTRMEEERIAVPAGRIDVVPAWRFLLDPAAAEA